MTYSVDDTQPVAPTPFQGEPINLKPTIQPDDDLNAPPPRGGSCLLNGVIVGMLLLIAVAIVALAAAAGWTSGQREANGNATATQSAAINEQIARIPGEIASGNLEMLDVRLRWLATLTPGVPGIADMGMTATALYQQSLATPTPVATATPDAPEAAQDAPTPDSLAITTGSSGGYDLGTVLNQAQNAAASSQWQDAIDYLDVILGTDPNFEKATVRGLMSQALNSYARELYNSSRPAEANLIVERAREFGPLADGLEYESMAASLYLTAKTAVGTGSPVAINALQQVIGLGPGRYYQEAQDMLYDFYVTRGDTFVAQGDNCSAATQYQGAMNVSSSGVANGKYASAQNACVNAPPTTDPNIVIPSDGGVAPVGVVATPGS